MESLALQLVLQLPLVALLFFAAFLFRGFQRERSHLAAAIHDFEARMTVSGASGAAADADVMDEINKLKKRVEASLNDLESGEAEREKTRDYMANQKTALKEFGRVLSRTSEQTYSELQSMEARLRAIEQSLNDNGFELDPVSEAA